MKARFPFAFIAVFLVLVLGQCALLWGSRLLPFIDLPNHLAAASVARQVAASEAGASSAETRVGKDPYGSVAESFRVDLFPKPNVLHLWFCRSFFDSVESANRIYYCLYVLLLPLSMCLLLWRLGGNPWLGLLSLILVYGHGVSWGFVGFTMAIPLALFFLCLCVGIRDGRLGDSLAGALCLVLVFFAHAQVALFCGLLLATLVLCASRQGGGGGLGRRLLRAALILAPLGAMILWWLSSDDAARGTRWEDLSSYYRDRFVQEYGERKALFYQDNESLYSGRLGTWVGIAGFVALALPLLGGLWRLPVVVRDVARRRALGFGLVVVVVAFACYLLLPSALPGQWNVFQRMGVFAALSLLLVGGLLCPRRLPKFAVVGVVLLCMAHGALWADYLREFQRRNQGFRADLFPPQMEEQALGGLMYSMRFRGRPVYIHFPSYYMVWHRGLATSSLYDFRFSSVRLKPRLRNFPHYDPWTGRNQMYDGRYRVLPYLLVRGEVPKKHRRWLSVFEPLSDRGPWKLLRRRGVRRGE